MLWNNKNKRLKNKQKKVDEIFSNTKKQVKLTVQDPLLLATEDELIKESRNESLEVTKVMPLIKTNKKEKSEPDNEISIKGFDFESDINSKDDEADSLVLTKAINNKEILKTIEQNKKEIEETKEIDNENIKDDLVSINTETEEINDKFEEIFSKSDMNDEEINDEEIDDEAEENSNIEYIKVPKELINNEAEFVTTEEYIGKREDISSTREFNLEEESEKENYLNEEILDNEKTYYKETIKEVNTDERKNNENKVDEVLFKTNLGDYLKNENKSLNADDNLPEIICEASTFSQLVNDQYKIYQQIQKEEYSLLEKEKRDYIKSLTKSKNQAKKSVNNTADKNNKSVQKEKQELVKSKKSQNRSVQRNKRFEYTKNSKTDQIKEKLRQESKLYLIKTIILLFTTVFSLVIFSLEYFNPQSFSYAYSGLSMCILNLIFIAIININGYSIIKEGLIKIFKLKTDYYSVLAIANVFVLFGGILSAVDYNNYNVGSCNLYSPLLSSLMFFFSAGKLLHNMGLMRNFNYISKNKPKYCMKKVSDSSLKQKISNGLYLKDKQVVYQNKVNFVNSFFKNSEVAYDNMKFTRLFTVICLFIITAVSVFDYVINNNLLNSVNMMAVMLCLCVPSYCLFIISANVDSCTRKALKRGAMITGIKSCKECANVGAIIVSERDLFPEDSVKLLEIRSYDRQHTSYAIQYAYEILRQIDHPLSDALKGEANLEYSLKVENLQIDEEGICAWVNNERVLIGTMNYMKKYYVSIPESEMNQKDDEIRTFVSLTGQLTFVISSTYRCENLTSKALHKLEECGLSFIVNTIDTNVTNEKVSNKFSLFHKSIKVLRKSLGELCLKLKLVEDEEYESSIVTDGSFVVLAEAIYQSKKLNKSVKAMSWLQIIAVTLSLMVSAVLFLSAGIESVKCIELFIFMMFWFISAIAINFFCL